MVDSFRIDNTMKERGNGTRSVLCLGNPRDGEPGDIYGSKSAVGHGWSDSAAATNEETNSWKALNVTFRVGGDCQDRSRITSCKWQLMAVDGPWFMIRWHPRKGRAPGGRNLRLAYPGSLLINQTYRKLAFSKINHNTAQVTSADNVKGVRGIPLLFRK